MNILKDLKAKISGLVSCYKQLRTLKYDLYKLHLQDKILHSDIEGVSKEKYCNSDVIVSLTSYGKRLEDVCFTIESIMQQTKKPNRIILWMDKTNDDFVLPYSLKLQQRRGLEIVTIEDNIRSYKKLIPALKRFPDDVIITIDDDLIYEFDIIERLVNSYLVSPTSIHACRTHVMDFNKDGSLKRYGEWKWNSCDTENPKLLFFTGVGGVLYPPHSLDDEVLNQEIFTSICKTADDVWFNAMALMKGTRITKVSTRNRQGEDYLLNEDVQFMGLNEVNNKGKFLNDTQIEAVFTKYNIYSLLDSLYPKNV